MRSGKKVAVIRGPSLNKWEMQNYEPMATRHDITAMCLRENLYDTSNILLKKATFRSLEAAMPVPLRRYWTALLHKAGYHYHMLELERSLAEYEVMHTADTWYAFSYQAALAKRRYGNRLVVTTWENIPFALEHKSVIRRLKGAVKENADLFLAVSRSSKQALIGEGVSEGRIRVLPMGVDVWRFAPMEKDEGLCSELGLAAGDVVFLFVGRLVEEKGILDLISAYSALAKDTSLRTKLVVAGEGTMRGRSEELARRLGVSGSVSFIGNQPYMRMPSLYSIADVFVLPSAPTTGWQEQFGMALVEAMACGKPIISTLTGAIPEVVGPAALLVQPREPLGLNEAMRAMALDVRMREGLGERARAMALERYDSGNVADALSSIYEGL